MKWVGLTGGIASGKTTVQKILIKCGVPVVDADKISHELTQKNARGYSEIVRFFSNDKIILDNGEIDRKKLGSIVFSDKEKLMLLEQILHPLVQEQVRIQRGEYEIKGHKYCFYDVPLLFEKNMQDQFDYTVLVYVSPDVQIKRLMQRNQLLQVEALQRINAQISLQEKIRRADFCLDNSTNVDDLQLQVHFLLKTLDQDVSK